MAPPLGWRVLVKLIWATKLGAWWLALRPLMDTLGKALLFGAVLSVVAPGHAVLHLRPRRPIAWRMFDRLILYATRSFDICRKPMREIDFPLLLVPRSTAAFPIVEIAVYIAVAGAILFFLPFTGQFWLEVSV